MPGIPDGLVVGGAATSGPAVLSAPADAVLRPKLGWRLLLGLWAVPISFAQVSQVADGTWEWPSLLLVVPLLSTAAAAWRKKVILHGDELHQQATLMRYPLLRAADIAAVTARRDKKDLRWPAAVRPTVLRLWLADGSYRGYVRFWWDGWETLAQWVAVHHTKSSPDGVPHWTIPTDGETMRRLAPLLENSSPG